MATSLPASRSLTLEEILRLSVFELKSELYARGISSETHALKRDLQSQLCQLMSVDIDPEGLRTHTVPVQSVTVGQRSVDNSPTRSVRSDRSGRSGHAELSADQCFELRRMEMEMKMKMEMEREQKKMETSQKERLDQIEMRKLEQQHELEMEKLRISSLSLSNSPAGLCDVNSNGAAVANNAVKPRIDVFLKLVPRFDPNDVHLFFSSFERAIEINKIAHEHRPAILHALVSGKAQRVLSALTLSEAQDYDVVKQSLLSAFDICAENFRKRFRNITKIPSETYLEFAFKIKEPFDRWLFKTETKDFNSLQQLLLLERFGDSFADDPELAIWLLNKKPKTLEEAARYADEFSTLRRSMKNKKIGTNTSPSYDNQSLVRDTDRSSRPVMHNTGRTSAHVDNKVRKNGSGRGSVNDNNRPPPAAVIHCAYCKKVGHAIGECYTLRNKNAGRPARDAAAVNTCLVSSLNKRENCDRRTLEQVDVRFRPHCFEATVIRPDQSQVTVMCLRDTAALQSLIRDFSSEDSEIALPYTDTNEYRQICGIGGSPITVPLVQMELHSKPVSGLFHLGVCSALPRGVDLLAGNDLFSDHETDVCVVTRSQTRDERLIASSVVPMDTSVPSLAEVSQNPEVVTTTFDDVINLSELFVETGQAKPLSTIDRKTLIGLQQSDPTVSKYVDRARLPLDDTVSEQFYFKAGVLMRRWFHRSQPSDTGHGQIVAPSAIRRQLLYICHDIPASGHLGIRKSLDRLLRHFWWGSIQSDVREYIRTCHQCQRVGKGAQKVTAPLYSMPIVTEPWSVCAIDIVGPMDTCDETGNRFVLTVLDLCTHYPEAIALKRHTARDVALALATVFSRVGFPSEILSDLGTEFTSELVQIFLHEFNIGHLRCSAYHPMSNGAVERFNGTMKTSLKTLVDRFPNSWDAALCWVLFALREVVNETTGFSPFELLYGRSVKGPLTLIKDALLQETDLSRAKKSVVDFMLETREQLRVSHELAQTHATEQRTRAKVWYDRNARLQEFKPGDKVLMLLPIVTSPLQLKLHGPYEVAERLGPVDYVINTPNRRKTRRICHVNLLRPYRQRDLELFPDIDRVPTICVIDNVEDTFLSVDSVTALTEQQQSELLVVLSEFESIFSDKPGRTTLCEHHIELLPDAKPVFCRPYRLSPDKAMFLKEELTQLLEQGIIEEAPSNGVTWASLVIMVPKADSSSLRLCTDMRQVNARTAVDPFPLPRIEELLDRVGKAKFLTKLDMVRGYWQVPLDDASIPISGFITPFGHFRWRFMHFGCRNAPATFSRLVMKLFAKLESFCAAYLDDILIFSNTWEEHKRHIAEVLKQVRDAGLTLNRAKCVFAVAELDYLGFHIGRCRVQPREKKIAAFLQHERPSDRKQLQQFLGLAGYYRRFLPNFSHTTAVLSNLLRKNTKFEWTQEADIAFLDLKSRLASRPILRPPDFTLPFCMAVDASNVAVGAYLFQVVDDIEHPICFYSKKLDIHQQKYSTVEKEALGLVLAVRVFSVYFGSSHVKVYTDHNPLVFLHKMQNHNQKLLRWSLELQQYSLEIIHRAGKDNCIPDLLSRPM